MITIIPYNHYCWVGGPRKESPPLPMTGTYRWLISRVGPQELVFGAGCMMNIHVAAARQLY